MKVYEKILPLPLSLPSFRNTHTQCSHSLCESARDPSPDIEIDKINKRRPEMRKIKTRNENVRRGQKVRRERYTAENGADIKLNRRRSAETTKNCY